jgi:hypothetical protein
VKYEIERYIDAELIRWIWQNSHISAKRSDFRKVKLKGDRQVHPEIGWRNKG